MKPEITWSSRLAAPASVLRAPRGGIGLAAGLLVLLLPAVLGSLLTGCRESDSNPPLTEVPRAQDGRTPAASTSARGGDRSEERETSTEGSPTASLEKTVEDLALAEAPDESRSARCENQATLADGTVVDLGTWDNPYPAVSVEPMVHWHPHWVQPLLQHHLNVDQEPVNYDPEYVRPKYIETLVDYARGDHGLQYVPGYTSGTLREIKLDVAAGKMFWMHTGGRGLSVLFRVHLDGKDDFQRLVGDIDQPRGLALDRKRKQVYWIDLHAYPEQGRRQRNVRRTGYDGGPIEDVVVGLHSPGGLAVDAENGKLYYADRLPADDAGSSLIVCNLDGSGERVLDITPRQIGGVVTSLELDLQDGKIYWTTTTGNVGIRRANLDGSQVEEVVFLGHWGGNDIWAFALDVDERKVYWADRISSVIRRGNLDGAHIRPVESKVSNVAYRPLHLETAGIEALVGGYNMNSMGFALDLENRRMYWTRKMAVERMPIAPLPRTEPQPAPPEITQITPDRQSRGGTIKLIGRSFSDTFRVELLEPKTGASVDASYWVNSDGELEVVVPDWETAEARLAIVVQTPGGVTVTLPQAAQTIPYVKWPRPREYRFERFDDPPGSAFWLEGNTRLLHVEHSLLFAEANSRLILGPRETCCIFLKNDSILSSNFGAPGSVIYHEPFAIINPEHRVERGTRLIQVPAIRPSVLPELLHYREAAQ